jgi:hypothetical protein
MEKTITAHFIALSIWYQYQRPPNKKKKMLAFKKVQKKLEKNI